MISPSSEEEMSEMLERLRRIQRDALTGIRNSLEISYTHRIEHSARMGLGRCRVAVNGMELRMIRDFCLRDGLTLTVEGSNMNRAGTYIVELSWEEEPIMDEVSLEQVPLEQVLWPKDFTPEQVGGQA